MKLILAIPAAGLICSGALSFSKTGGALPSSQPATPQPATTTVAARPMRLSTDLVYKGESFELRFDAPNPSYLGVIDPDGKFFYVVFPTGDAIGNLQPLVDSKAFTGMKSLKINTAVLKADPYTYGVYDNQPVFTKSGTYRFVLGDNLNVDNDESVCVVKLRYKHIARPGVAIAALN
jgi:hypothetical protein